jgi:hypothetical protein
MVTQFSVMDRANGYPLAWLSSNISDITYANSCPALEVYSSLAHFKALEILKLPEIQERLTSEHTTSLIKESYPMIPNINKMYLDQRQVLKEFSQNEAVMKFTHDLDLQRALDRYNAQMPAGRKKISNGSMILNHYEGLININKLYDNQNLDFQNLLLNSYIGLEMAKSGDKDIAVYIQADYKTDHNGAFDVNFKQYNLPVMQDISKKHPWHIITASNVQEMIDKVKSVRKNIGNIKIIYIAGHGNGSYLRLGTAVDAKKQTGYEKNALFSRFRISEDSKEIENKLPIDSDGLIILDSCSGGKDGVDNENNLVNQIALSHKGVTVLGYKMPSDGRIMIDGDDNLFFSGFSEGAFDISYRVQAFQTENLLNRVVFLAYEKLSSIVPIKRLGLENLIRRTRLLWSTGEVLQELALPLGG